MMPEGCTLILVVLWMSSSCRSGAFHLWQICQEKSQTQFLWFLCLCSTEFLTSSLCWSPKTSSMTDVVFYRLLWHKTFSCLFCCTCLPCDVSNGKWEVSKSHKVHSSVYSQTGPMLLLPLHFFCSQESTEQRIPGPELSFMNFSVATWNDVGEILPFIGSVLFFPSFPRVFSQLVRY